MYQNSQSAITPSQKTGAETKNSENPRLTRSMTWPRRSADSTPMGTPRQTQTSAAPMASVAVITIRPPIRLRTEECVTYEAPRPGQPYWSPNRNRLTNSRYCSQSGWLSPRFCCTWAMSCGVGCLPANSTAGLTGGITK